MQSWQFQEAKAKLTQLVNKAAKHPQLITRHGSPAVVVMNVDDYEKLTGKHESLVSFLRRSPLCGVDLKIERSKSPMRDIDL
jgi:antitoxin Phd